MAGDNQETESCCEYPDINICDVIENLPRQYQQSSNIKNVLNAYIESINCVRESMRIICQPQSCKDFSGDGLTAYGSSIGFPRCQCNIRCGFEGEQCIEDDDLYCRLIEAYLIQRRGPTVQNLCDAIKCLFGDDAFIINATNGVTQIATGRALTTTELEFIKAIRSVIPRSCATRVEIYEISEFSSIFGVSCGDGCTSYGDLCDSDFLCNPVLCEDELEVLENQPPITSGCDDREYVFGSNISIDTSIYFSDPDGGELNFFFLGLPSWLNSNSSGFLFGEASESGDFNITVIAQDSIGAQVSCDFTINIGSENTQSDSNTVFAVGDQAFNGSVTYTGIGRVISRNQNGERVFLGTASGSTCGIAFSSFYYDSSAAVIHVLHSPALPPSVTQFTISQTFGSSSVAIDVSAYQGQSSYFVPIPSSLRNTVQFLLANQFTINGDC